MQIFLLRIALVVLSAFLISCFIYLFYIISDLLCWHYSPAPLSASGAQPGCCWLCYRSHLPLLACFLSFSFGYLFEHLWRPSESQMSFVYLPFLTKSNYYVINYSLISNQFINILYFVLVWKIYRIIITLCLLYPL